MAEGEEEDNADKPFDPTPKRLEEARRKGDVPRSADLTAAAGYAGLLLAAVAFGGGALAGITSILAHMIEDANALAHNTFDGSAAVALAPVTLALLPTLAPWFGLPFLAALLGVIVQQAFIFAGEKLKPKISRISPIEGAKQKFGRGGLFEFAKSTVKLIIFSACLGGFILWELPLILATLATTPAQATVAMLEVSRRFLAVVVIVASAIAVVDYAWQRAEHIRKNRMSRREIEEEVKQNEGDPALKARRRERAMDIATNRMLDEVPGASVVIVNPRHYAVALAWDRRQKTAPVCVAKGTDLVAARIRAVASEAGVPIRFDPPTARALYATVEIGAQIPPEHYRAVAAAIRFADAILRRARRR
ncbi:MAG: flagellar type III secretion system protein FlhB [Pseudomonadota bacterium]